MSTIGEVIHLDADAEFRSDVQLDAYEKPYNLGLIKSYLFTSQAPTGYVSSIDVLTTLIQSFSNAQLDNRMIVIANYGHGKSHLALALANFFGRKDSSPECQVLFEKIDQTLQNPAKSAVFRAFKTNNPRHLVLCLRGDVLGGIRSQFIREIERALAADPALKDIRMPFWFQKAEKELRKLSEEQLQKANEYLAEFSMTVEDLLEEVQHRNMNSFERVKAVFKHIYGFGVDFMEEVGLKEMVNWAVGALCGAGKPYSGILILMDEFSLYIQNYVSRGTFNELQDLMNGLDNNRQKVAFVAFGQHEPIQYVRSFNLQHLLLQDIERELNRIPKKYFLYSLMESVIDSYLYQDQNLWKELEPVRGPIVNASSTAYDAFPKRYREILRWNYDTFDQRVTRGCFPLHPLTTA